MDDKTKQFALRAVIFCLSLVFVVAAVLYMQALFDGKTEFPPELRAWLIVTFIALGGIALNEVRRRDTSRKYDSMILEMRQLDQLRAMKTEIALQNQTDEIKYEVNNGGPKAAADLAAQKTIATLAPLIVQGDRRATDRAQEAQTEATKELTVSTDELKQSTDAATTVVKATIGIFPAGQDDGSY